MRPFYPTGRAATLICLLTSIISSALNLPTNTSTTTTSLTLLHKRTNVLRPVYVNGLLLKGYQELAIALPLQITAANLEASTWLYPAPLLLKSHPILSHKTSIYTRFKDSITPLSFSFASSIAERTRTNPKPPAQLFYGAIIHKVDTEWLHTLSNPLTHVAVKWNGIELHFVTNAEAPPDMGIPWEFVRDFTKMMYEVSQSSVPADSLSPWALLALFKSTTLMCYTVK